MTDDLRALFADPDRYLFGLPDGQAQFVPMSRAAYARSLFLDRRIEAEAGQPMLVPAAGLAHLAADAPVGGIGWIFHIAHCGSTLLARALDRPGDTLVLREPVTLRQLGLEAAHGAGNSPEWGGKLRLSVAMLARRYPGETRAIVKANVPVNLIVDEVMAFDPEAPAIFLYYALDEYLAAILRSPVHRDWVERVTAQLEAGLAPWCGSLAGLSIAERAAALWLAQMRIYADALCRFAHARSLDAEQLFNAPKVAVAAAYAHFGVAIEKQALDDLIAEPLFTRYSKGPHIAFDNAERLARKAAVLAALGEERRAARALIEARLGVYPLPEYLPRALAGTGAARLL
jgi:hypothetical protein